MSSKAKKGEEEETTQQVKLAKVRNRHQPSGRDGAEWDVYHFDEGRQGSLPAMAARELVAGALVAPMVYSLSQRKNLCGQAPLCPIASAHETTRSKAQAYADVTLIRPAHRPHPTPSLSNH